MMQVATVVNLRRTAWFLGKQGVSSLSRCRHTAACDPALGRMQLRNSASWLSGRNCASWNWTGDVRRPAWGSNCHRLLTSSSDKGDNAEGGSEGSGSERDRDPFGVHYEDGEERLGPLTDLPPRLVRDPSTGTLTGEVEREVSADDKYLLSLSDQEKLEILANGVEKAWSELKKERLSREVLEERHGEIARLVRGNHPDRTLWDARQRKQDMEAKKLRQSRQDMFKSAKHRDMTDEERKYDDLLESHGIGRLADRAQRDAAGDSDSDFGGRKYPTNPWDSENLAWVAQDVDVHNDDVVLPPELERPRKLNRRQATPLPKSVVHHNNLALLRRYVTPGGQIMPRLQSRLGAKDQRKIAKLVKRARSMGLIPHVGEWKVKDDGDVFATDLEEPKEWEKVMFRAGLLSKPKGLSEDEKDELRKQGRQLGIIGEDGKSALLNEVPHLAKPEDF